MKILVFSLSLIPLFISACGDNAPANSEESQILKIAKDTAIKVYGYDISARELPLKATLTKDSIWIVTDTLGKGENGGTVYIEISSRNKRVTKITHYK